MAQAFWGSRFMSWTFLVPDVLRELRYWSGGSSCPWGFLGLILCLVTGIAFTCGFILATLIFSDHCRRFLSVVARGVLVLAYPSAGAPVTSLQQRLREYHPHSA